MTDATTGWPPKDVRILLIDDQVAMRVGLRLFFESEPLTRVVGEAATALDGIRMAAGLLPDVVILDLELPDLDGVAATTLLKTLHPNCIVILLSIHDCPEAQQRAAAAGVWAFVAKGSPGELQAAYRSARQALSPRLR